VGHVGVAFHDPAQDDGHEEVQLVSCAAAEAVIFQLTTT
jgi:hypothetical protein